jgi:uncharacterized protein (TIGR02147 family)
MAANTLPRVQDFQEYREYLREWFVASKSMNAKMSYRYVARMLGLRAPNHFQLVITKQRHFSKAALRKMQGVLRLRPKEKNYLDLLFNLAIETREDQMSIIQDKISRLKHELGAAETPSTHMAMLSNSLAWFMKMGALRFTGKTLEEIVCLVKESCPFSLTRSEILAALDVLIRIGDVNLHDERYWFELDNLKTGWDLDDKAVKQFHANNLALAIQTVSWPVKNRFLSNVTIPCNSELIDTAKQEIRDLCLRLLERSNSSIHNPEDCQQVVALQFAMYPYFEFGQKSKLPRSGQKNS